MDHQMDGEPTTGAASTADVHHPSGPSALSSSMLDLLQRLEVGVDKVVDKVKVELETLPSHSAERWVEQQAHTLQVSKTVRQLQLNLCEAQARAFRYHRTVASLASSDLLNYVSPSGGSSACSISTPDQVFLDMRSFLSDPGPVFVTQRDRLSRELQPVTSTQNQIPTPEEAEHLQQLKNTLLQTAKEVYQMKEQVCHAKQELQQYNRRKAQSKEQHDAIESLSQIRCTHEQTQLVNRL